MFEKREALLALQVPNVGETITEELELAGLALAKTMLNTAKTKLVIFQKKEINDKFLHGKVKDGFAVFLLEAEIAGLEAIITALESSTGGEEIPNKN